MNIEEFRANLIDELNIRLDNGYKVMPCETLKNNGLKLHGIILKRNDKKIAPTIYIENVYAKYCSHQDISKSADEVIKLNDENTIEEFDTGFYEDFSRVRKYLYVKLVSRDDNMELLSNTPHRNFMDLSLIVYCDVSSICKFDASIIVKSEHIKLWGVGADDIIDIAIDNTRKLGCSIKDVTEFLYKKENNYLSLGAFQSINLNHRMYVMTNKNLFYGAICMTYDDRLDEFCNRNKCNTYIIPSSIHEVILVPDTGEYSGKDINSMIKDVNRCELAKDEILSNHAYYYSVKDGYICV